MSQTACRCLPGEGVASPGLGALPRGMPPAQEARGGRMEPDATSGRVSTPVRYQGTCSYLAASSAAFAAPAGPLGPAGGRPAAAAWPDHRCPSGWAAELDGVLRGERPRADPSSQRESAAFLAHAKRSPAEFPRRELGKRRDAIYPGRTQIIPPFRSISRPYSPPLFSRQTSQMVRQHVGTWVGATVPLLYHIAHLNA